MARSDKAPERTVLEKITCPKCGHFAAYKLDETGTITYDKATGGYRCAILSCHIDFIPSPTSS